MSRKQFGANGVSLRVKRRLDVLYVQHLVDQTIKLALTFPQNFEKVVNLSSDVSIYEIIHISFVCCCHAVFQGVSQWLNSGVHLCVDVSVGQCTRHNLHHTNHIEISTQRIEC